MGIFVVLRLWVLMRLLNMKLRSKREVFCRKIVGNFIFLMFKKLEEIEKRRFGWVCVEKEK